MIRFLAVLSLVIPVTSFAGVTVHYSGELASGTNPQQAITAAADFAKKSGWQHKVEHNGITLFPAEWCEPLHLSFNGSVLAEDFVKTQFAGVDIHVKVVQLLRTLKPLFSRLNVDDEGEYWETRNMGKLEANIKAVNLMLQQIKQEHPSAKGPTRLPDGRIIDVHT